MRSEFETNFDKYAYETGGWAYDNGWRYQDQFFGASYVGERFDDTEADCLLVLREGPDPQYTYALHYQHGQLREIWAGLVASTDDYEKMMQRVREYAEFYRTANATRDKVGQRQADS
jgi:hypothetical protein